MLAPLIVRRRTEPPRACRLQVNPLQKSIEGKVEVETRLFTVGDHIEPGLDLIANRNRYRVVDQFRPVRLAEFIEVRAGEFEPAREWVAADHCRSQRLLFH